MTVPFKIFCFIRVPIAPISIKLLLNILINAFKVELTMIKNVFLIIYAIDEIAAFVTSILTKSYLDGDKERISHETLYSSVANVSPRWILTLAFCINQQLFSSLTVDKQYIIPIIAFVTIIGVIMASIKYI